ncbi:MAG: threonine aldolase [Bacteroidetes bacterium]|nr:threonine aldolase [Bacteroidota bacterium]MBU1484675.1 threonine aldolase [Bacteroidota bacterium]MBU2268331.1 threonine aldolase [Bacteroidota bacterium]MBU2376517.1 threonine aldolase [Bacteroidota bacterium]
MIDFRSDTVTKPTEGMLAAMFTAKVGDDVFGEDETVNALEKKTADLFGMEAGMFCPSGTMTNQIAIKCFTQPLDEVITDQTAHVYRYEGGGIMFNSAASVRLLNGDRGRITAEMIETEINPIGNVHHPHSSLVVLENTVNRGGGSFYTLDQIEPIYHLCRLKGLKLHLDGARIFNALAASGDSAKGYGQYFDGISVCLSKGLGAPVGSVLLASKETIKYARRVRKVMGGGMRQAGFLAAAGIYALDHHIERLKEDHLHAQQIADSIKNLPFVKGLMPVDTNIIIFELNEQKDADHFVEELKHKGILCGTFGKQMIRFVTHLDITADQTQQTIDILKNKV